MKCKKYGFTLVELLTVLAIIALLAGILIPSLTMVRNIARETKQKAQLAAIDQALMAFRSDYGDYPPSGPRDQTNQPYCGAQKLTEALLGWDLLGFHPQSVWRADGLDAGGGQGTYDPPNPGDVSLNERVGPYLDVATANAFRLGDNSLRPQDPYGLFNNSAPLNPDRFVLCDSFGAKKITVGGKTVKAGTPILYYRANTSKNTIEGVDPKYRIYNYYDNRALIALGRMTDGEEHPLRLGVMYQNFYDYITDPKVTARPWPYRADSYILISAGADGLYGTSDDITNFGN